ncbi:MAG: phytanoyl-CoA dioxygenase family protein [Chloroflexota bacterium]
MQTSTLPYSKPGVMTEMDQFIFECFGFIVIEDVLNEAECDEALEACKRVHAGQAKDHLLQMGKGFEHEPAIEALIDHPAVLPKVRAIYGDNFVLQAAWCTVQPAGSQSVGWHTDGSSAYDFKKLAYPVPLIQLRASYHLTDQSKPYMGNMILIPGSHRSKLDLPKDVRKEVEACAIQQILLARRGSVLLFHNGVWHSPMPNNMTWDRYNMHFIYSPPWVRRSDRDETDAEFLEHTTPRRRALMGDYARPDVPFAGGFPGIPFDDNGNGNGSGH